MTSQLCVTPPAFKFGPGQESALQAELFRLDRCVSLVELESAPVLTADGLLNGRWRLTSLALKQLCELLCKGLKTLVTTLCAQPEDDAHLVAVNVLNQFSKLFYRTKLAGRQFLCDNRAKTIDAVISTSYQFLSNLDYYNQVEDAVKSAGLEAPMYEAALNGRWLLLRRYVQPALFTEPGLGRFFAGMHFTNYEGGHRAASAYNTVVRGEGGLTLLPPVASAERGSRRLIHAGGGFQGRLAALVKEVMSGAMDVGWLRNRLKEVSGKKLGLSLVGEGAAEQAELIRWFVARRLPSSLAARVVAAVMLQGVGDARPKSRMALAEDDVAGRTRFDLMVAACREAKKCSISVRERVERAAYDLLAT